MMKHASFLHLYVYVKTLVGSVLALFILAAPAGSTAMLTPQQVTAALHRHAVDQGPWKPENIEVRVLPFQTVALPAGETSLRVLRPTNGVTPGVRSFLIGVVGQGKEHARFWVKAEIRVYEDVVVSSQAIPFREMVKIEDLRLERRDVSQLHDRPYVRVEDVVGQQTARTISVNETLTQKSLQRPHVVRRGSAVVMVYETGSLRVETPGIAEENGKAGELIQVKNPASGKLLRGLVVDGRIVRVN